LTSQAKAKLLQGIDKLTAEQVDNLGKFLATEKKIAIEKNSEMITDLENLTKTLKKKVTKSKK
jgi:hypothetical protein